MAHLGSGRRAEDAKAARQEDSMAVWRTGRASGGKRRTRRRPSRRRQRGSPLGDHVTACWIRPKRRVTTSTLLTVLHPKSGLLCRPAGSSSLGHTLCTTAMASSSKAQEKKRERPPPVDTTSTSSSTASKLDVVSKAIMAPFAHRKHDSTKVLADCTCMFYVSLSLRVQTTYTL